jgi:hypothetical protein
MHLKLAAVASAFVTWATTSAAQEGLEMFSGSWKGSGEYIRLNGDRVNVQCDLETDASSASLNMNGRCTALVFISRSLSANIKSDGTRISGWYSGPEGKGAVRGEKKGTVLDLSVQWEKPVRGDDTARMQIEVVGKDRLWLRTFDLVPAMNSTVTVTDLDLQRQ